MGMFDMMGLGTPGTGMLGNPLAGQGLLTGGNNPWLVMLGNAIRGGLAGVAASRGTKGFGPGLGIGSVAGVQSGYEAEANKRRNAALQQQIDYQNSEIQLRQQEAAERAADAQRVEAFISSLPPEQQGMARLAPKEVIAQRLKQMYPDGDAPKTVGGMQWNATTKSFEPIPGYTDQAKAIAEAGRAPRAVTINQAPQLPKTIEERDQQVLLQGDPSSPDYAMAYTRTFMNPRFVQGTDAQGNATMVPIMPAVPPNIRKPTYMGGAAAGAGGKPGAGPTTGPAASGSGPAAGQPIVTGIAKGQTEDARKNQQLYQRAQQQLSTALENFDDLAKTGNQVGSAVPLVGNALVTEGYQRASSAIFDIAASYLYSVSGATATREEVQKTVAGVMPVYGDGPQQLADKKARLKQMVDSIKVRAGNLPGSTAAPAGGPVIWKRDANGKLVQEGAP